MISKEALNRIAQQTGLSLYQQEKDYVLKLFLHFYYKKYKDAVFKGGTCLRYLFGVDRFSEDLDFNITTVQKYREQVHKTLENFKDIGINYNFIKEEVFEDSYTCTVGVEGPLFAGTTQTQNKFRIDAGYWTGTFKKSEWKVLTSEYPETAEHILTLIMDFQEIFVEKIITLFKRKKGRDLYDIWFLSNAGIKLDAALLRKKVSKEKVTVDIGRMCTKQEYERDMSKLTNRVIPYQQVRKEVLKLLDRYKR
jgi:uncharacterized protein